MNEITRSLVRLAYSQNPGSDTRKTLIAAAVGESKAAVKTLLKSIGLRYVSLLLEGKHGYVAKTHPSKTLAFRGGNYGEYTVTDAYRQKNAQVVEEVRSELAKAGFTTYPKNSVYDLTATKGGLTLGFFWQTFPTYMYGNRDRIDITYWLVLTYV